MGYETGFRQAGNRLDPESAESVRATFWDAVGSGMSPTAAATVAGVSGSTGRRWAKSAGYQPQKGHFGIRYSAQVKDAFWDALRGGASTVEAAVSAGVSEHTGRRWIDQAGYVPRTPVCAVPEAAESSRSLSFRERCQLENLLEAGLVQAEAARRLGRSRSTVCREVKRGATSCGYRAQAGQDKADAARARPKDRKLEAKTALRSEVVKRLEKRHSPEQIMRRLREDFPDDPEMWVSHETIYQAIYVQPRGELARELKTALRTGRIRRKAQGRQQSTGRGQLKDMVNISERPAEVEDRAVPGHWEGDLIIGANSGSAIGTLVERTTGFTLLLHLPGDHTAATVAAAMTAKMPEVPEILRRSLTWDQGKEMALHAMITAATGMPVFFCDPHSPWQRGTNENTNGLLRQYFPKGTDLSVHGPGILDNVAAELNGRPRKRLGWRTPAEELDRLLSDPTTFVAATA